MHVSIINMNVDVTSVNHAKKIICGWALKLEKNGRYVCVSNVHMCMESFDDRSYAEIINRADLTVPDGMPVFLAQRALGQMNAQQVRGEDLTLAICLEAEEKGLSVGFLGSTTKLLSQLECVLIRQFPKLDISYISTLPFVAQSDENDRQYVGAINDANVDVLFVGLGCPKQEIWMAERKDQVDCTMIGVGAAFDFIAGNKKHAPLWMQKLSLEWLFRFLSEPRRLWWRYLKHNPRFVYYFILQLLGRKYD